MKTGLRRAARLALSHPDAVLLGLVVLTALAVRLGFALRVSAFITKDSQSYFLPGWDLVHEGQFPLGLRRTPIYPAFISVVLLVFGDDLRGLMLAQHALGAATAGLTYLLGSLTFGRACGAIAGLIVALSAPVIAYEHFVLTESLFTLALTAATVALVLGFRSRRASVWVAAGALVGVSTLIRPIGQLGLAIGLATVAMANLPSMRRSLGPAVALIGGFALIVGPWSLRNQFVRGEPTPSTFGRTLIARTAYYDRGFVFFDPAAVYAGADPSWARARQIIQQGAERRESDGTIAQKLRQELGLDGIQVNAVMRDAAIEAIAAQPLYFIDGTMRFAVRIFNGIEVRIRDLAAERRDVVWEDRIRPVFQAGRDSEDDFRAASKILAVLQPSRAAPVPLALTLLATALALGTKRWRSALVPAAFAGGLVIASAALDGPQERYRYPVDPSIAVLAVGAVIAMASLAWRARPSRRAVPTPNRPPRAQGSDAIEHAA